MIIKPPVNTCGPPQIQNTMMNVTVKEGQEATFKCMVRFLIVKMMIKMVMMMMMMMMMNVTIKGGQEGTMVRFLILICNILFQHFLSVDGVNLTQSLETNF